LDAFFFIALPYITLLVFIVGMAYRFRSWMKTPQPAKITLFPAPPRGTKLTWGVIQKSLFFPGLFRGDRLLWGAAWIFHAALALIIVGHLRVFTAVFDRILSGYGVRVDAMSSTWGGIAGIVILAMLLVLLLRRFVIRRVREISNLSDLAALLLLLAIVITGNLMRFGAHFDLQITREYFTGLCRLSLVPTAVPQDSMFQLHFLLVQLLLMYIPYSKILHFGGIFFTQTLIQRS